MKEIRLPLRNFVVITFWLMFASWLSFHALLKLHATGQGILGLVWPALMFASLFTLLTYFNRR